MTSAIEEVFRIARAQTLVTLFAAVPGYWATMLLIDRVGRFAIQLQGFALMTIFMLALAIPYNHWVVHVAAATTIGGSSSPAAPLEYHDKSGFVALYAMFFFFCNFGPNSTTFIVPAELFPARLHTTCYGISAAAGKAGAIVGTFGFLYAAESLRRSQDDPQYPPGIGPRYSLFCLAATNALGLCCTFLVDETNQVSLQDMSGENDAGTRTVGQGVGSWVSDCLLSASRKVVTSSCSTTADDDYVELVHHVQTKSDT